MTIASGQMPSIATSSSATVVPMASARPANCQAKRPMSAIIASVGRPVSRLCTQFSVLSMGRRTVWKKGRKCSTTQPRPWLIQDSTGSEPSHRRCNWKPLAALSACPAS